MNITIFTAWKRRYLNDLHNTQNYCWHPTVILLLLFHLLNKRSLTLLCKSIFTADRNPCVDHLLLLSHFCYGVSILPFLSVDKHFTQELSEAVLQQLNSSYNLV